MRLDRLIARSHDGAATTVAERRRCALAPRATGLVTLAVSPISGVEPRTGRIERD